MKLLTYGLRLLTKRALPTFISRQFAFQNCTKTNPLLNTVKHNINPVRQIQRQYPRTPDLIYVPHVFRWLKNKIQFVYLKKSWDPEFSEGAFIYGTTRALCKITEIIHSNKADDLEGLLTHTAKLRLETDMARRITKIQKQIILLRPNDIKILVPIAVNLKTEGGTKRCVVSLRSLALKWYESNSGLKLILVALQSEFVRDYTYGTNSEWTISGFEVLECAVLSESPSAH